MNESTAKSKNTQILLNQQINDLYCLETASKNVLPKFKNASVDESLKATLDAQFITLKSNLDFIEKFANQTKIELSYDNCKILRSIIHKSELYLENGPVTDTGILCHMDRINQYKTVVYNSAVRFAKELNYKKLYKDLENIKNYTYNINDRLARLLDSKSDEHIIENL